tara:strand:- start:9837 stop:11054 length:1218 start_codon:yes stop_codon:yes gene_type:complete
MAINVNTVYTTVLSILNKEQRGYITPDEFNKLAAQVQLEIFENYFEDYNQLLRIPQTNTEYVDRQTNINSAIAIFKTFAKPTSVPIGAVLDLSITVPGTGYADANNVGTTLAGSNNDLTLNIQTVTPGFTISTPGTNYTNGIGLATVTGTTGNNDLTVNINSVSSTGEITGLTINQPGTGYTGGNEVLTITQAGSSGTGAITLTSASIGAIASASVNALGSGYSVNDVVNINGGGANATATINSINTDLYFLPPSNTHRIGTVIYKNKEIQRVDRNELLYLNLSPITKPSETFPVYLYEQATQGTSGSNTGQQHVLVYPKSITTVSDIDISYIRKPNNPIWGFTVGTLGQYIYNSSTSTQFELSNVEQTEVIVRILAYAGVVIRDPQIVQVATQAIQAEESNSKS